MLGFRPISMIIVVWCAGIILFFNMFLGPLTNQLKAVNSIVLESNNAQNLNNNSIQAINFNSSNQYDNTSDFVDYTPLAIFDNFFNIK